MTVSMLRQRPDILAIAQDTASGSTAAGPNDAGGGSVDELVLSVGDSDGGTKGTEGMADAVAL